MGKDFKNKIGSKRLDSLIPSDAKNHSKTTLSAVQSRNEVKAEKQVSATTVATFRVNSNKLHQLKAIAYWDRKKIQDVLDEALESYLNNLPNSTLSKAVEEYSKSNKM